jgi:hypothetical protein
VKCCSQHEEENKANYCKILVQKTLFSAWYDTCTVTLNELKAVLNASSQAGQTNNRENSFIEV